MFAAILQFLLAVTFVVIPIAGLRFGPRAQHAAEAEITRQGHSVSVLKHHKINFSASRASVVLATGIAVVFAVAASLNLAGHETMSWIVQPIILILGLVIMPGEVFVARYLKAALPKEIDVAALTEASAREFPLWTRGVIVARFALATVGSVLVCVSLAL